jgi:cation diffusion facilitator CzcD-associated flavoprotein CzcO
MRFWSRGVREPVGWRLGSFEGIYEKGTMAPVDPNQKVPIDWAEVEAATPRTSYQLWAWAMNRRGYPVPDDRLGDDERSSCAPSTTPSRPGSKVATMSDADAAAGGGRDFDAVVVGAGLSGLYALHRLRQQGLDVRVYDRAADVGGTWWYNRYPGARVDTPTAPFYSFMFSPELAREWDWAETQPDQPAILSYLSHVADRLDLRRDIQFESTVSNARFDAATSRWRLQVNEQEEVSAQFLVLAVGTLSESYLPDIAGIETFAGRILHTGQWPHEPVDFSGERVGVIGTGSSGVQVIPFVARQADQLTVFQRTPQYVLPGRNRPLDPEALREARAHWTEIRERIIETGKFYEIPAARAVEVSAAERQSTYEKAWERGGLPFGASFADHLTDEEANGYVADFVRERIREVVMDPEVADRLVPTNYFGTKRLILGEGYYETYNRDNVTLVDLREEPIERVEPGGIRTGSRTRPLDTLVLATGYDALTGALLSLDPAGAEGVSLAERWADGVRTYLGIGVARLPNLFLIHGPQTPSVKFHTPIGTELQVEWIAGCIDHVREHGFATVEPVEAAEQEWGREVASLVENTLYPRTDSWFNGANIPGKPREFMVHIDGPRYHRRLREVAAGGYPGFEFR